MSFSGLRRMSGKQGANLSSSTGSSRDVSPSFRGGQRGRGTRGRGSPPFRPQQCMASNVTARAPHSNSGNSGRNPQATPGSLITEHPTIGCSARMSENTGGTTQRTISLNSLRHPMRHIHVDVPERPKKPFIYSKMKSPVSKALKETASTTLRETVLVSLPTPSGEGRLTGSNQSEEAYETVNISIIETASITQDTGFTHDSGESSEGIRSLLLQPVIQEESRSDSVEASVSAVSKSAPIELTDSR